MRVWIWRMVYRRWWPFTGTPPNLAEERRALLFFIIAVAYLAVASIIMIIHVLRS